MREAHTLTHACLPACTGAYGVVNLVIERSSGRDYACKVLPKKRGRLTPEKLARKILTEVELLNRVQVRTTPQPHLSADP